MIDLFLKFLFFFFLFQLLLYLYIVGKGIDKIPIFSKREITYQDNSIKRLYFNFNIHDTIIRDYYSFLLVTSRWADNFPSPIIFRNIIHFPVQYLNWSKINIIQTSLNTPDNYRCLVHHWFYLPFYIHTYTEANGTNFIKPPPTRFEELIREFTFLTSFSSSLNFHKYDTKHPLFFSLNRSSNRFLFHATIIPFVLVVAYHL